MDCAVFTDCTYMGIARGLLSPWVGLAPILGGAVLTQFGYSAMLAISAVVTTAGIVLVTVRLREPRLESKAIVRTANGAE